MANLTPMMQQYLSIHEQVPDAILFFRLGDFYEMFFDDAITASKTLDIVLTGKDCGLDERAPMCGVPYHAADNYIAKLIEKGFKVAICEQVSDPKESKGIVDREIIRIITSGTVTEGKNLKENDNNYLMSVYYNKLEYGVVYSDISTGETTALLLSGERAETDFYDLVSKIMPAEILVNTVLYQTQHVKSQTELICQTPFTPLASKYFNLEDCIQQITRQLKIYSLNASGMEKNEPQIKACGALFRYLEETQKISLSHINKVLVSNSDQYMHLDFSTKRNLELTETMRSKEKKGSLLWVIDQTVTSIGSRLLKQWVNAPLNDIISVKRRHDALSELTSDIMLTEDIMAYLKQTSDIQRLCSRISYMTVNGRDLLSLKNTLRILPKLKLLLLDCHSEILCSIRENLCDMNETADEIDKAINPDCGVSVKDGNLISSGYHSQIDQLRNLRDNARNVLAALELKEKEKSGIKNLKIKYNKVFGYYFEISKSNLEMVPEHFIRKQTLVNAERYYTEELKEIENRLLNANDELIDLEFQIFSQIVRQIGEMIGVLQQNALLIGTIDVLCSMGYVSYKNKYVRPYLNNDGVIRIENGKHPVIEQMIGRENFIANDTLLDTDKNRMSIITGPNMSGKSTFIRQVAIISLMCQIGCFVPCSEADLCIVDRIFTRVGASDDLASGQSTFMVEMSEVSNILKYATKNSLVILDEVGRGTSTLDGLSIAWAVAEFLHDSERVGCKTLFATHYHELTELEKNNGIVNYSINVKQSDGGILFLHKIKRGSSDKSYGVDVAKLAGLPNIVIERAEELLQILEEKEEKNTNTKVKKQTQKKSGIAPSENLLNFKAISVAQEIQNLPIDDMTPIEVMNFVSKMKHDLSD